MSKENVVNKNISVTMISNAMNHHQISFCDSMNELKNISFYFIATKPISKERLGIGFQDLNNAREYIVRSYESSIEYQKAINMIDSSDFVIYGSASYDYIKDRKKSGKWIFIYSERLFKKVRNGDFLNIKTILACLYRYFFSSHKNLRLLCASAFAFNDYRYFRFKSNEVYKWGYFPSISNNNLNEIMKLKENDSIIWVGRMIDWKHPELAVYLAKQLKKAGISFTLKLVGDGPLLQLLKNFVSTNNLEQNVKFLGVLNKDDIRIEMERSEIMIATSDYNEGWGAVVNEGMASACSLVASNLMGSVPFLINNKKNGLVFTSENLYDLTNKVKQLLNDKAFCKKIGENAFYTINNHWNGKVAAQRLAELMNHYYHNDFTFSYKNDICSCASILPNDWVESI